MFRTNFSKLVLPTLVLMLATVATPSALFAAVPVAYERIVTVSPVPGNPTASGANLLATLGAVGPASSANRWLIEIEPGIYDVKDKPVEMIPWVDIAGAGTNMTVIRGLGQSGNLQFDLGVVNGADDAEMRDLTVECRTDKERRACITIANYKASPRYLRVRVVSTTPGDYHWGFRNTLASPRIEQVEIVVANGIKDYGIVNGGFSTRSVVTGTSIEVTSRAGEAYGLWNVDEGTTGRFEDSRVTVEGQTVSVGIYTAPPAGSFDPVTLRDVTIDVRGGEVPTGLLGGSHVTILEHCKVTVEGNGGRALYNPDILGGYEVKGSELYGENIVAEVDTVRIATSQVAGGGSITGFFTEKCAAVYDGSFTPSWSVCP